MTVLDTADLVVIAGRVLGIGTDAALAQMDVTAARDALAQAALAAAAAAPFRDRAAAGAAGAGLVHAMLRHRPFPRHCEQVAIAAGLQFLSLNGWRADLNPPAPAVVVVEALASGQLTPAAAAAWLSARLSPARPGLNPARRRLIPARRNEDLAHARPDLARPARRVPPATWGPVRRTVASVLHVAAVGGASLLAAACSRGPDMPAAPAGRPPASTAAPPRPGPASRTAAGSP